MDWTTRLQAAKDALPQDLLPALAAVREQVGPAVLAAARDDETLTKILQVSYFALPLPVQMLVSRDRFIQFCLANRDILLGTPNPPRE
jgi:hypothetical protein